MRSARSGTAGTCGPAPTASISCGATSERLAATTYLGELPAARSPASRPPTRTISSPSGSTSGFLGATCHEGELERPQPDGLREGPGNSRRTTRASAHRDMRRTRRVRQRLMASFDKRKTSTAATRRSCSPDVPGLGTARGVEGRPRRPRSPRPRRRRRPAGDRQERQWRSSRSPKRPAPLLERYLRRRGRRRRSRPALFVGTYRQAAAGDDAGSSQRAISLSEMLELPLGTSSALQASSAARSAPSDGRDGDWNAKVQDGLNDTTVQHIGRWRDGG